MKKNTLTMKNFIRATACLVFVLAGMNTFAQEEIEFVRKSKILTTPTCTLYAADFHVHNSVFQNPELRNKMLANNACSTFIVNYSGFTPEAEAAFQYAVDIWANSIESSQPITISASFQPLAPGVLGQAGPVSVHTSNAPDAVPNVFYPKALAEKLEDAQINPDPFGGSVDITVTLSSNFNFYFGTDAMPPGGQFDFVSIVLHEVAHGLGFGTSFRNTNGITGSIREPNNNIPTVYDLFIENGAGQSLLDTNFFADPSTALHVQLTGGDLFNNSPLSINQNGGVIPEVYAPSTFQGGSSYAHWDSSTIPVGNINSLMRPSVGSGIAIHDPGPITLGVFEDMGWSICGGSLSIEELNAESVEIGPNPFMFAISIKLKVGGNDDYTIDLFDVDGRLVLNDTVTADDGLIIISSDLYSLESAMYFIRITNKFSGNSVTKKIIKG